MGSPAGVQQPVDQQQSGAFLVLPRIEARRAATGGGEGGRDFGRAAGNLGARGHIQRMQSLVVRRTRLRHRDGVDHSVRSRGAVDDRGRGDSDFRRYLSAAMGVARRFAAPQ